MRGNPRPLNPRLKKKKKIQNKNSIKKKEITHKMLPAFLALLLCPISNSQREC